MGEYLTVDQLCALLDKLRREGHGNKLVRDNLDRPLWPVQVAAEKTCVRIY